MVKQTESTFKNIAILTHPHIEGAAAEADKMAAYLQARQINASCGNLNDYDLRTQVKAGVFDLVIAIGGDGTVLRAGHLCAPYDVPILPVNMGSLGFLIEVTPADCHEALDNLLSGEYWFEDRMMLHTTIVQKGEEVAHWDVLNDCVVARGSYLRPVHLQVTLDGQAVTTFVADALLAATPTGSTAYSLAAGGPILPPSLRNFLIVPVAPHFSIDRAIVLAQGSTVSIRVLSDHDAVVSGDGQTPIELERGDLITVRASDYTTRLVRFEDVGYFYRNLVQLMDQNPSAGDGE